LRFVVEASLEGHQASLKERCIGATVFGRETDYDTAEDPIVRNAAIEVRKRLAQYYLESEHAGELRIDLPLGSYAPIFAAVETPVVEIPPPVRAEPKRSPRWIRAVLPLMALAIVAASIWYTRRTPASELDAFWDPLLRAGKSIQICIGQPTRVYRFVGPRSEELNRLLGGAAPPDRNSRELSIHPDEVVWSAPEYLFMGDAFSAFNVASWVQSKGRAYQLIPVSETNYSRLRHAPLVAIGAFNNAWSMRVTAGLRFVFDQRTIGGAAYNCIIDRRDPSSVRWSVLQPAGRSVTQDYAIVTRVFDPSTEQTVVSAAGIAPFGTQAASEFVTRPEYLGAALRAASRDWRGKNMQFVLETKTIDGTPGPPHVLATHFW
jgi:hypothetical protein